MDTNLYMSVITLTFAVLAFLGVIVLFVGLWHVAQYRNPVDLIERLEVVEGRLDNFIEVTWKDHVKREANAGRARGKYNTAARQEEQQQVMQGVQDYAALTRQMRLKQIQE